ncbi:RNA-directed DNA polymerase, eukaryota [Tanacetum coccineum]
MATIGGKCNGLIEENSCSSFARKRLCIRTKNPDNILESFKIVFKDHTDMTWILLEDNSVVIALRDVKEAEISSADPFELYKLLQKNNKETKEASDPSLTPSLGQKAKKEWIKEINFKHNINLLKTLQGNKEMDKNTSYDTSSFGDNATISDNFIALYGTWLPSNTKVLIVSIYAPQSNVLKRTLWEFISVLISRWDGETIVYRRFLMKSGMQKKDIVMRSDFGPNPKSGTFFFHSWFDRAGFDEMVEQAWSSFSHSDTNCLIRFKKKLQELKQIIRRVGLGGDVSDELHMKPIRWDYLLDVLKAFGFGPNWCKWIRGIFSSSMASILVNGSPTPEFKFHCGLKQGDPLAPFLFILIMESLHISVSKAVNEGVIKGLSIQGLKINLHKSKILGVGVPKEIVDQGASLIGCEVLSTPFTYLGGLILKSGVGVFQFPDGIHLVPQSINQSMALLDLMSIAFPRTGASILREVKVFRVRRGNGQTKTVAANSVIHINHSWDCDFNGEGDVRVKDKFESSLDRLFLSFQWMFATKVSKFVPEED